MGSTCSTYDDPRASQRKNPQQPRKRRGSGGKQVREAPQRKSSTTPTVSFSTTAKNVDNTVIAEQQLPTSKCRVKATGAETTSHAKRSKPAAVHSTTPRAQRGRRGSGNQKHGATTPNPLVSPEGSSNNHWMTGDERTRPFCGADETEPSPTFAMPSDDVVPTECPLRPKLPLRQQKASINKIAKHKLCANDFVSVLSPRNERQSRVKTNSIGTPSLLESTDSLDQLQRSRDSFGSICIDESKMAAPQKLELPRLNSLSSGTAVNARIPRRWGEKKLQQASSPIQSLRKIGK